MDIEPNERARRWVTRATEQLGDVERRLAARLAARLIRQRDPRDAESLLAQLAARRVLPAPGAPRFVPTETGLDEVTRALARLSRADRGVLMELRGVERPAPLGPGAAALARRAAFRRLTETYSELRRPADGVGGLE